MPPMRVPVDRVEIFEPGPEPEGGKVSVCVHCRAATEHEWFDMTMCPDCEAKQRAALSRIAKMIRNVWADERERVGPGT